jgi:Holliday junction resolvase RusA-like endonuclease
MMITLTEQIPSGKNAMGITRAGRHYAKPRFTSWRDIAAYEIQQQKRLWPVTQRMALPILGKVVLTISYCELIKVPANGTRDLSGCLDALFHLLTYTGILENDGQVKGVTWMYPWRTEGPCVEMEIRNG